MGGVADQNDILAVRPFCRTCWAYTGHRVHPPLSRNQLCSWGANCEAACGGSGGLHATKSCRGGSAVRARTSAQDSAQRRRAADRRPSGSRAPETRQPNDAPASLRSGPGSAPLASSHGAVSDIAGEARRAFNSSPPIFDHTPSAPIRNMPSSLADSFHCL